MKYPTIALRFSDILNLRGIRARELAEKADMTESAISHYVNGNRVPGNKTATKLGKILDVNPLWLMDLSADMETEENKAQAKKIADELVKLLDADDIKTPPFTQGLKKIIQATEKPGKICDVDDDI